MRKIPTNHLINELQELYNTWGDTNSETIDKSECMPATSTYTRRFGSLSKARETAAVKKYKYKPLESAERAKSMMREKERSGERVTQSTISGELKTMVAYADKTLKQLREEAGLIRDHSVNDSQFHNSKIEMIEELRKLDGIVTDEKIDNRTSYTPKQYAYQFGTSTKAKEIAGVTSGEHNSQFWHQVTGNYDVTDALDSINGYNRNANYYVYRLQFKNNVFYVGATNDIKRRMSEKEYWPNDNPTDIYIESFEDKESCEERESEITFETAIEFDTNDVYGGHHPYSPEM